MCIIDEAAADRRQREGGVARDSQSQTENEPKTLVEGLTLSGQCVVNQRNDPWLVLNFNLISSPKNFISVCSVCRNHTLYSCVSV